jgi:mRNA interferase RelE/StbE
VKSVTYKRDAAKALRKHANMAARIRAAIETYASDQGAHANNVSQLVGSDAKRMRIGDFRAIFDETETEIFVTKIAPRSSAYD